jgi:hypothetical protein
MGTLKDFCRHIGSLGDWGSRERPKPSPCTPSRAPVSHLMIAQFAFQTGKCRKRFRKYGPRQALRELYR